jgi:hypothetical protein
MTPTIVSDRLYSILMRPQELALYGDKVRFDMRYSPIFEDENEVAERHFKLLILEIEAVPPATRTDIKGPLVLLKCGWEIELSVAEPTRVGSIPEIPREVALLLERIADTANELARRAGLEAPLGPDVVEKLLAEYRTLTPRPAL